MKSVECFIEFMLTRFRLFEILQISKYHFKWRMIKKWITIVLFLAYTYNTKNICDTLIRFMNMPKIPFISVLPITSLKWQFGSRVQHGVPLTHSSNLAKIAYLITKIFNGPLKGALWYHFMISNCSVIALLYTKHSKLFYAKLI